jgi:hypothetical protein
LASTFELTGKFPDQLFRKKNVCYVRILSRVGSADENAQGIVKIGSLFTPVIKLTHYLGEEGKYKKKERYSFSEEDMELMGVNHRLAPRAHHYITNDHHLSAFVFRSPLLQQIAERYRVSKSNPSTWIANRTVEYFIRSGAGRDPNFRRTYSRLMQSY